MGQGGSSGEGKNGRRSLQKSAPARRSSGAAATAKSKPQKPKTQKPEDEEKRAQEEIERLRQREAQAAAEAAETAAQIEAQLAAVQQYVASNPVDDDDDDFNANGNGFDPSVNPDAAAAVDDGKSIGEVSVHSSDFRDEELMQGLRDIESELEEDFNAQVTAMQERIEQHKQNALRLVREAQDREGAKRELQCAKELEKELAELQRQHELPLGKRMEALKQDMDTLEEDIAAKKKESLAALRRGEKPTAIAILKEAKEMESQLEGLKASYAALETEREQELRSAVGKETTT